MQVTVSVTAEDIARGHRGHACQCPIARALLRAIPGLYRVHVRPLAYDVHLDFCKRQIVLPLPYLACEWANAFDEGKTVEPFTFELEVPDAGSL